MILDGHPLGPAADATSTSSDATTATSVGGSVRDALRAAEQQQQGGGNGSGSQQQQRRRRQAAPTDGKGSQLTRRFGPAGGGAWGGVWAVGRIGERGDGA